MTLHTYILMTALLFHSVCMTACASGTAYRTGSPVTRFTGETEDNTVHEDSVSTTTFTPAPTLVLDAVEMSTPAPMSLPQSTIGSTGGTTVRKGSQHSGGSRPPTVSHSDSSASTGPDSRRDLSSSAPSVSARSVGSTPIQGVFIYGPVLPWLSDLMFLTGMIYAMHPSTLDPPIPEVVSVLSRPVFSTTELGVILLLCIVFGYLYVRQREQQLRRQFESDKQAREVAHQCELTRLNTTHSTVLEALRQEHAAVLQALHDQHARNFVDLLTHLTEEKKEALALQKQTLDLQRTRFTKFLYTMVEDRVAFLNAVHATEMSTLRKKLTGAEARIRMQQASFEDRERRLIEQISRAFIVLLSQPIRTMEYSQ